MFVQRWFGFFFFRSLGKGQKAHFCLARSQSLWGEPKWAFWPVFFPIRRKKAKPNVPTDSLSYLGHVVVGWWVGVGSFNSGLGVVMENSIPSEGQFLHPGKTRPVRGCFVTVRSCPVRGCLITIRSCPVRGCLITVRSCPVRGYSIGAKLFITGRGPISL